MMPGITPSLLMAGAPPIYNAYVSPSSVVWSGDLFNYYTDLYVEHSGGTAPFTYLWSSDAFSVTIDDPTVRAVRFRSSDGSGAPVECLITDAMGQQVSAFGTILSVGGGV